MSLTHDQLTALFTRADGTYFFARWGRPIVPVIFGLEEGSLSLFKGAIEGIVHLAGHKMAKIDPELGANVMMFFCRSWNELPLVPNLERLVPDMAGLCQMLTASNANQYKTFRFDAAGAIKAAFVFIRMDETLEGQDAQGLALAQAAQVIVLWSHQAFQAKSSLGLVQNIVVLRPDIGAIIQAAYDPTLPAVAYDAAHSLRLFARVKAKLCAT